MHKKKLKYIPLLLSFVIVLLMLIKKPALADNKNKKTTRISKRNNFTSDSKIRKYKLGDGDHIKGAPPDPGGGGDGWPIPISDGIGFLLMGGIAYLFIKKKIKRNHN